MYFEFYLNDLEVEQPGGFNELSQSLSRDPNWHGVFFESTLSSLQFYGEAATYLREQFDLYGQKADVTFRALQACGVYEELEELIIGKLDFGRYNRICGEICLVGIPVEKAGCTMIMRNRYDQKVDIDNNTAFDRLTAIGSYSKLGEIIQLPAHNLEVLVKGTVGDSGDVTSGAIFDVLAPLAGLTVLMFRPNYENEEKNSIRTGQLIAQSAQGWLEFQGGERTTFIDITPQLLFDDNTNCFSGTLDYIFRLKGTVNLKTDERLDRLKLKVVRWNGSGFNIYESGNVVDVRVLATPFSSPGVGAGYTLAFDETMSASYSPIAGEGLYAFLEIEFTVANPPTTIEVNLTFNKESLVDISSVKSCPPTDCKVYAVNEVLSRIVEAITNNCMKVKSDYYGRTDSQPYSSSSDGCGGLRVFTSGLYMRNAPNPKMFISLKTAFEGLKAIDNIGLGVEPNPNLPGKDWLRIEEVDYFYQDVEVLRFPNVPTVEFNADETGYYSSIKIGYKKWEAEEVNSLDEPNSNKDFRTDLSSVNRSIDLTSEFVSGSYVIELTRQETFADTGGADTKYDNEIFIICVDRTGYGEFVVEQGNILNPNNVFSPQTLYNWRIRPWYNLMRWFKSIANSYANIDDTSNKLYFTNGTGNLLAEGELALQVYSPDCKLENGVKAENRDMSKLDFQNPDQAKPLWKPMTAEFEYPLSIKELKQLKQSPYGYISFQCGNEWFKGYINNVNTIIAGDNQGKAKFNLRLKWD